MAIEKAGSFERGSRVESAEKNQKTKGRKKSEYGRQLEEKQKVKNMYGMRERQFRRFFGLALRSMEATGDFLLSLLERRLDNVAYRLKIANSRSQARQMIVHGHVLVNGTKVTSPSYLVNTNDVVSLASNVEKKEVFMSQVVEKRLNANVKVPDWLELDRKTYRGTVLRLPVRADVPATIEEHLIVELYSK